jgi:hypothetical protein
MPPWHGKRKPSWLTGAVRVFLLPYKMGRDIGLARQRDQVGVCVWSVLVVVVVVLFLQFVEISIEPSVA